MERHRERPHQGRDVSDPLSHSKPLCRGLKPAIVNLTLRATISDKASAATEKIASTRPYP